MSLAERLSREERPDQSAEVRDRVQERLVEVLGARLYDDAMSDGDLRRLVDTRLRELLGRRTPDRPGELVTGGGLRGRDRRQAGVITSGGRAGVVDGMCRLRRDERPCITPRCRSPRTPPGRTVFRNWER